MNIFFKNNSYFLVSIVAVPAALARWQVNEIFITNILGCFLLGMINASHISRKNKLIFGFGFCGSLTSFSGWAFKLFDLISQGLYTLVFLNSILIVLIGCFTYGLGHILAKQLNH